MSGEEHRGNSLLRGGPHMIKIDDRVLAHLKVLVGSKLRRNEPFLLSWQEPADEGHGRSSVWIHTAVDP